MARGNLRAERRRKAERRQTLLGVAALFAAIAPMPAFLAFCFYTAYSEGKLAWLLGKMFLGG